MRTPFVAALIVALSGAAWATPFDDSLVQPPSLGQPNRGSIEGTLSHTVMRAADVTRGSFRLTLAIDAPEARGPLLARVFPAYSSENGLSEWGVGWSADLAIRRHRDAGDLDYQTDGYSSPWGPLELGVDGEYYPRGLAAVVKATATASGWEARTADGTVYRFEHEVTTPRGTYAWMLTSVTTVLDDRTTIAWTANATGRAFVERVRWGGRGDGQAYEAELGYETLAAPRESYASGARMELDRRVSEVIVRAKNGSAYAERWRYALGYTSSPFGPAFYLTSIDRRYPSGEAEPAVTYDYDMGVEQLAAAPLVTVTGLEPLLAARGGQVLNPDRGAMYDLDDDGLIDFEDGFDQLSWRQTAAGQFAAEALPSPTGAEHPLCRAAPSSLNHPRRLVRMHPGAAEPQVVGTEYSFGLDLTSFVVCDRNGMVLFNLPLFEDWRLGPQTRLTDVNGDLRPDLVRVSRERITVLPNASEGEGALAFGAALTTTLSPQVTSDAVWLLDANGDGKADLIKRMPHALLVWPGKGGGDMETTARPVELERDGEVVRSLDQLHFAFGDYNNDGLIDAVITVAQQASLYINRGDRLVYRPVPALAGVPFDVDGVILADLTGSGEEAVVFTSLNSALAVRLSSPSIGLMRQADDGRGTRLTFAYRRADPADGVARRPPLLDELTVATAGYDAVTSTYGYAAPVVHRLGRYLIGFGEVTRAAPMLTETATFANDDDLSGLLLTTELLDDRTPDLARIERHTYEEAEFQGIRWARPTATVSGWRAGNGEELTTTSQTLEYEREICPTRVEQVVPGGTLRTELELASVSGLDDALHCMPAEQRVAGEHSDRTRDFDYSVTLTRNGLGQLTRLEQHGGAESLVVQEIGYDATTHRIASVSSPGRGAQTFTYDPATGQLDSATAADGVVAAVQNRDPRTDAVLELVGNHGPGGELSTSLRYDGMERLAARWADFGGSSEARPLEAISYRFPAAEQPGLIQVSSLVDGATRRETASWLYPDGAELASATRIDVGWEFGAVSTVSRADLRVSRSRRAPLADGDDLALQTYGSLRAGGTELAEVVLAGFGRESSRRELVQQGVERRVATTLSVADRLVVTASRENDAFETRTAVDAGGRLVWQRNQTGAVTRYDHDALGRLIGMTLVDGTRHRLTFDELGRPGQVVRDGIGTITYSYEPETGRLDRKDYRDADGVLERTVDLAYDAIGRVVARTHVRSAGGGELRFKFLYDGDVGDGEVLGGQRGYATRIEGPAYSATVIRNPDGSEASSRLVLGDWMQIDVVNTYYANGVRKEAHRMITRLADSAVIDDVVTAHAYDAWGRLDHVTVNDELLATIHYDEEGRFAWADLPSGQRLDQLYDPLTHEQNGYTQKVTGDDGTWQSGVEWDFNNRGLVAAESIDLGDQSWLRSYRYDARGFLDRTQDASQVSTYSYTPTGLPKQITDERGTRSVFRGSARTITVEGTPYTYDTSGRLTARGDAAFTYGPDGHLSVAHIGSRTLSYEYDADGNRILKVEDGTVVAGYVGRGYLTDDLFVSPIEIDGRIVGVLEGGVFQLLATDPRGTVLADRDGTPRLASAYGVRGARPDLSAALDYVEKAYDADLDSVRMGVRDYDPVLSQFWTPDPLYLESIDKCTQSPIDCNLFSYAHNNPVTFVDPTGMDWKRPFRWIGREALPRVFAAGKVVGAGVAFGLGAGLCKTGIGCVAGAPLMLFSADVGQSAAREVWYGKPQSTVGGMISPDLARIEEAAVVAASLYASFGPKQYLPASAPRDTLAGGAGGLADDVAGEAARGATAAPRAFGGLSRAGEFGIKPYGELRGALQGTGLQAHHLIEQRFAGVLGQNARQMLSVGVTRAEHQAFTNAWRAAIPYGPAGTGAATRATVQQAARDIYSGYPEILKALGL